MQAASQITGRTTKGPAPYTVAIWPIFMESALM
jgi:hypothetical protein